MIKKRKKISLLSLIICGVALFFSISIGAFFYNPPIYADKVINISNDTNFSKYTNLIKGGIYENSIDVSVLHKNPIYKIPTNFVNKYGREQKADDSFRNVSIYKDYGFKVNGSFYTDNCKLDKPGKYFIEVFSLDNSNEEFTKPSENLLETFEIKIVSNDFIKLNKKDFYFEHYNYELSELISDIQNSFNVPVKLSANTLNDLKIYFNNFINSKSTENNEYDKSVEVSNVKISYITSENIYGEAKINLCSIKNPNIVRQTNKYILFKENEPIALNIKNIDASLYGSSISEVFSDFINFKIDAHPSQIFEIKLKTDAEIPSLFNKTEEIKNVFFEITDITDESNKLSYIVSKEFYFYQYYEKVNDIKPVINLAKNHIEFNTKPNLNDIIGDAYLEIEAKNGTKYKDYTAISNIQFGKDELKTDHITGNSVASSPSDYESFSLDLTYLIGNNNTKTYTFESQKIKIFDSVAPLILTRYNKYFLDKKDIAFFYKDIRVIDNETVNLKIDYKIKEQTNEGGIISVRAEDASGNVSVAEIPFLFNNNLSFFQKTFGQALYKYGKFLREIF